MKEEPGFSSTGPRPREAQEHPPRAQSLHVSVLSRQELWQRPPEEGRVHPSLCRWRLSHAHPASAVVANKASTCHLGFLPPAPGPCQPAGEVSKAPRAPSFPKEWVPPGRARTKQKALWEPYPPQTPGDTYSDPVPGHALVEVMQHNRGGGPGEGPQSPAPCPQGRLLA